MYEPPLLDFYDNAILNNGDPASYTVSRVRAPARARRRSRPAWRTCRPGSCCRARASRVVDPDFKTQSAWLSNVQVERALNGALAVSVGYVNSIGRNLPVLIDVNLIPTGATLRRRPADLLDRRQRRDPRRSDVRPRQHVPVDRRVDLQRVHRDADQADDARLAGAGDLHAGARRRQRAAHRHLRRRQRRRSRVGSVEPGSRQGRDAVQPDAHLLAVDGDRAAGVGDDGSARRSGTTTRSGSSCRRTAGCRSTSARTWI